MTTQEIGIQTTTDNRELVQKNEIVYLAVKPYKLLDVLEDIAPVVTKQNLIVSVAAGITIASMEKV